MGRKASRSPQGGPVQPVKGPTPAQSRQLALEVLRPVIHLLRAAGISESALRSQSEHVYRRYARMTSHGVWLAPDHLAQATRAVKLWSCDPDFLDAAGVPRPLPLRSPRGSFACLVRRATVDVRASDILALLEAVGSVRRCDNGRRVRLITSVSPSVVGSRFLAQTVLDAVRRLAETAEYNVCGRPAAAPRRSYQRASCACVDPRQLAEVQRFVHALGETFLESVQDKLLACAVAPVRRAGRAGRARKGRLFGVDIHVYVEATGRARRRA